MLALAVASRRQETLPGVLRQTWANMCKRPEYASVVAAVLEWQARFLSGDRTGLLLYGPRGSGKSFLARCIWNHLLFERPPRVSWLFRVAWVSEAKWFADHKQAIDPDSELSTAILIEHAQRRELLFWDDFGIQGRSTSGWSDNLLFQVFDWRYDAGLPTVFTANMDARELSRHVDGRVLDRITGRTKLVHVNGPSWRQLDEAPAKDRTR